MLQNIIYKISSPERKEYKKERNENKPKIKNMRSVDRNGNIVHRPIHRREFQRSTALRKISNVRIERFYYPDEQTFNEMLLKYNSSEQQTKVIIIHTKTVFLYGFDEEPGHDEQQQQQQRPPAAQPQAQEATERPYSYLNLQQQNIKQKQKQKKSKEVRHKFRSCGLLNVRMRFCSRCGDENKDHEIEPYFVDVNEVTSWRTIFCLGCLSQLLRCHHEYNMTEFK